MKKEFNSFGYDEEDKNLLKNFLIIFCSIIICIMIVVLLLGGVKWLKPKMAKLKHTKNNISNTKKVQNKKVKKQKVLKIHCVYEVYSYDYSGKEVKESGNNVLDFLIDEDEHLHTIDNYEFTNLKLGKINNNRIYLLSNYKNEQAHCKNVYIIDRYTGLLEGDFEAIYPKNQSYKNEYAHYKGTCSPYPKNKKY